MPKTKQPETEVVRVRISKENVNNIRIAAERDQRPFANMLNRILTAYFADEE